MSLKECKWEPLGLWPTAKYDCGPTSRSGTDAGAGYKFCPYCGKPIDWKNHEAYK